MSVKIEDRPIETLRQETIDQLILNYSHGILSNEAFERRLDQAMATQVHQELEALVSDLTLKADPLFKERKEQRFNTQYSDHPAEEAENIINVFGGTKRSGLWQVPKTINVFSLFGGSEIDFSDAIFTGPNVTIKAKSIFGGEAIYVPENVNVVTKTFCIFGGISNKAPSIYNRQAPTITIEGFVLFGGIDISIKRTVKEKFVAFANELKSMFHS